MATLFSPDPALPLYRQVAVWLEERIHSGQLSPGTRLPSTDGLAAELGVGRKVIQQALASLSKRGLLDRSPGRGTFVSPAVASLRIAVVFQTNLLTESAHDFNRLVCNEFLKKARHRGFQVSLFFPTGADDLKRCKHEIEGLARHGDIRGIVTFGYVDLQACPVPCIVGSYRPASISPRDSLAFRGLSYLISRGYRSIAILEHQAQKLPSPTTHQAVEQIRADHVEPPHITFIQAKINDPTCDGRMAINDLISTSAPLPQALLSLDDNLTRSAIFAILEHNLRIPEDIAVLSHANKGSAILSPVPLTLLEVDPAEYASQALEALEARLEGREPEAVFRLPRLLVGHSCGE